MTTRARPRRRRRLPHKGEVRRAFILQIARQVFAERGYKDAHLGEICRRASIGRATLYAHFPTKRALLDAMVDEIGARIEAALAKVPLPATPPPAASLREALVAFSMARMETTLRAVFADEDTVRLLVLGARGGDDSVERLIARVDELITASLEQDLQVGQQLGALRPVDTAAVARFCLGGLQRLLLWHVERGAPIDFSATTRLVIELELFGLSALPA